MDKRIETWFLIPLVRNSDKKKHVSTLWGLLREEVYKVAGGWSGPIVLIDVSMVPGGWLDQTNGKCTEDESRKYTVIIPTNKIKELKEVLYRAANSFDQDEILFLVKGVDQRIKRSNIKGFLKGDPAGG